MESSRKIGSNSRIIYKYGILTILIMGIFGLKAQVQSKAYDYMLKGLLRHTVAEAHVTKADSLWHSGALFLDARELEEYEVSHIRGAKHVGFKNTNLGVLDSVVGNFPIVVYCSVGYRSEKIAEQIRSEGFEEVYNLYGGIFEWVNQGKPIYKNGSETYKIHPYSTLWGVWLTKGVKTYSND